MAWHYLELSDLGHLARAGPLRPQAMERPHAEMVSATPNEEMAASWVGNCELDSNNPLRHARLGLVSDAYARSRYPNFRQIIFVLT